MRMGGGRCAYPAKLRQLQACSVTNNHKQTHRLVYGWSPELHN